MKKTAARIFALALALLLAFALSACGDSFESAMARAIAELQKVQSQHMDMEVNIAMSAAAGGESVELPVSMSVSMDAVNEPMLAHAVMDMELMGESAAVEYYIEQNDGEYTMYIATGSLGWVAQSVSADDLGQFPAAENVGFYLECASAFEKSGEEEINGSTASRYDGDVPADMLSEALKRSGAGELLGSLGLEESGAEGLGAGMSLSVWLDKESGLPVRYRIDMSALMDELMSAALAAGADVSGVSMEIGEAVVDVTLSNFNGVSGLEIPAEVRGG